MNYLEWKKRILIYLVSRGKPMYAAPEELEFYLYSKFKAVNPRSLPAKMAVAIPVGVSVQKAVDCIATALSAAVDIYIDDRMAAAQARAEFAQLHLTADASVSVAANDTMLNVLDTLKIKADAEFNSSINICRPAVAILNAVDVKGNIAAIVALIAQNVLDAYFEMVLSTAVKMSMMTPSTFSAQTAIDADIGIVTSFDFAKSEEITVHTDIPPQAFGAISKLATVCASGTILTVNIDNRNNVAAAAVLIVDGKPIAQTRAVYRSSVSVEHSTVKDIDVQTALDNNLIVGVTPVESFLEDIVSDIDMSALEKQTTNVDKIQMAEQGMSVGLPSQKITMNAALMRVLNTTAVLPATMRCVARAECISPAYISDYEGITVSSLAGRPISSFSVNKN